MFAKVFTQIFDSSIAENHLTRLVFTDLLTLCDATGIVDMTHEAIARRTNVPIETVKAAIAELESPDPRSRTPDKEGRRIERLDEHRDWGWQIVNYVTFRNTASEEQRKAKTLDRVRKFRERNVVTPCNAGVTPANASNAMQMQRKMQRKMDKNKEGEAAPPPRPRFEAPNLEAVIERANETGLSPIEAEKFFNYYESNGWRVGKNPMKSWLSALATWKLNQGKYGGQRQPGVKVDQRQFNTGPNI